ncbi:MAG: 5-(carboxyamino)imidazole ribonucleotide mutase [Cardiobacteriaceae bacterium]|nr:5-(carboxyamino)imidazole ribonucleotide mutase [Cardiobacteriaceae bacterium]
MSNKKPVISIVMGSDSDLKIMQDAAEICREFQVNFELSIVSAHRTPERMFEYAKEAHFRGVRVIIAGAGGAAHLPGMIAAISPLPVIGVPIKSSNSIDGWDSVLSILQMPNGIPVATVALNAAKNAGLLAIRMLATADKNMQEKMLAYQEKLKNSVLEKVERVNKNYAEDVYFSSY